MPNDPTPPRADDPQEREARVHDLKTWPEYFARVLDGTKTFEIRKNDRDFRVGDTLRLREWRHRVDIDGDTWDRLGDFTGREVSVVVSYLTDFAQQPGHVVMGFRRVAPESVREERRWENLRDCDTCNGTGYVPLAQPEPVQGGEDYHRGFRDGLAEAFRIVDAEWYDHHSTQRHEGANLCAELMERLRKRFAAPAPSAQPAQQQGGEGKQNARTLGITPAMVDKIAQHLVTGAPDFTSAYSIAPMRAAMLVRIVLSCLDKIPSVHPQLCLYCRGAGDLSTDAGEGPDCPECDGTGLATPAPAAPAGVTEEDRLRRLLARYVMHVRGEEGIDFLDPGYDAGEWTADDSAAVRAALAAAGEKP